jgi:hypothetical protein
MTATQKAAKRVASIVTRVHDGAHDTRVPTGTFITIQRGKNAIPVVIDFSRSMNRR